MSDQSKPLKAVIWDLDNTLWDGVLLESSKVALKEGAADTIRELDSRGILLSIASKNEANHALSTVRSFGLGDYFLFPEIGWGAKSSAVERIQKNLNIGMDAFMFLDDQAFERDEVRSVHPEITCADPGDYPDLRALLDLPALTPRFITQDSHRRRLMYLEDQKRVAAEEDFSGPKEEFLAGLKMEFSIHPAREEDLKRAEELTVRTHQFNATGRTYSYDELNAFRSSPNHELLVCELTDRYGTYGKIGLCLVERSAKAWIIRLMLMSCRVISRGVGTVLLTHIIQSAHAHGVELFAEFLPTDRNRAMYVSFRFSGFQECGSADGALTMMKNDFSSVQSLPKFMKVKTNVWKNVSR